MSPRARSLPSREKVATKLRSLIAEEIRRDEAAAWASPWLTNDDAPVEDQRVWEALTKLAMADLISTDRPYLYGEADFRAWLDELLR